MPKITKENGDPLKFSHLDVGINPNFFIYTNPQEIIDEHLKHRKITNILSSRQDNSKQEKNKVFDLNNRENTFYEYDMNQKNTNLSFKERNDKGAGTAFMYYI